jgi:hypothetical protein
VSINCRQNWFEVSFDDFVIFRGFRHFLKVGSSVNTGRPQAVGGTAQVIPHSDNAKGKPTRKPAFHMLAKRYRRTIRDVQV